MIGFVGMSHLGIVYSVATAAKGFDVIGYDPSPALCGELSAGRFPIAEPGLTELFEANRPRLRFSASSKDISRCELVFISRDVPTDSTNHSDLGPLRGLIDEVADSVSPNATVVVLCQVPPGFTRSLRRTSFGRGGLGASLFYQVETLVFGNAIERALRPERFIVGCEDPKGALPDAYSRWLNAFDCP